MVVYDNKNKNCFHIRNTSNHITLIDLFTDRFKAYTYPLGNNRSKNKLQQSELNTYIKRKV